MTRCCLQARLKEPQEGDQDYEERKKIWTPIPHMEPLLKLLRGNVGVILTNGDLIDVKDVLDSHAREAPAKVGAPAQKDVWIPAGPTGLDPKQTAFFQNL